MLTLRQEILAWVETNCRVFETSSSGGSYAKDPASFGRRRAYAECRAQAAPVSEIPVQFVGQWCQVAGENGGITGTYRRARCPGKNGL
jgi:hypothetical protein